MKSKRFRGDFAEPARFARGFLIMREPERSCFRLAAAECQQLKSRWFGMGLGFCPLSRFGGEGWGEGVRIRIGKPHSVADFDPLTPTLSRFGGRGGKTKPPRIVPKRPLSLTQAQDLRLPKPRPKPQNDPGKGGRVAWGCLVTGARHETRRVRNRQLRTLPNSLGRPRWERA